MNWNDIVRDKDLVKALKEGGVVVMPTDTIYGIVGEALNVSLVNRIYQIRRRAPDKPCILLISGLDELKKFSITFSPKQKDVLEKYWSFDSAQDLRPNSTSIILDCQNQSLEYLHRGTNLLAFRIPMQAELQKLLKETGPLIAPSANLEGFPPAQNITEAKKYFGNLVDLYIDGGEIKGKPSKI